MSLDQSSQYRDDEAFFTIRPNTDSLQSENAQRRLTLDPLGHAVAPDWPRPHRRRTRQRIVLRL